MSHCLCSAQRSCLDGRETNEITEAQLHIRLPSVMRRLPSCKAVIGGHRVYVRLFRIQDLIPHVSWATNSLCTVEQEDSPIPLTVTFQPSTSHDCTSDQRLYWFKPFQHVKEERPSCVQPIVCVWAGDATQLNLYDGEEKVLTLLLHHTKPISNPGIAQLGYSFRLQQNFKIGS